MEIIVVSLSAAASVIAIVVGGIKTLQFISERPKREEVMQMIDGKLEVVNVKIDMVITTVKRIADALDKRPKR